MREVRGLVVGAEVCVERGDSHSVDLHSVTCLKERAEDGHR